jgi:hypothetical protein
MITIINSAGILLLGCAILCTLAAQEVAQLFSKVRILDASAQLGNARKCELRRSHKLLWILFW